MSGAAYADARLLVVDDEEPNVDLLLQMLAHAGYTEVRGVTDPRAVMPLFQEQPFDLILLDLRMPHVDGFTLLEQIRDLGRENDFLPIVVLTADITPAAKQRALAAGASDFLTKPFDHAELVLRVQNLLHTRSLYRRLRQQYQLVDGLYRQAQQASVEREQAQSAISHDLGHPLAVIRLMTRLLRREAERAEAVASTAVHERAGAIDEAATRMLAMLQELLDTARLQAGRPIELDLESLDLVQLVREEVEAHQELAGGRIRMDVRESRLESEWDAGRLHRVVANLLSNAIKYSPNGGEITLTLDCRERGGRMFAVLEVQDRGIGIPAVDLPRIFEPFHRAANVAGRFPGTGIGLAGARQVAEAHGGSLRVESAEGAGTRVTLSLPLI